MAKAFRPKVLTANRLIEGDVVYYGTDGQWVSAHEQAQYITDESVANDLIDMAMKQPDLLVGAYLADAALENGHPVPTHFREAFRTRGPSNYPHGKQEGV